MSNKGYFLGVELKVYLQKQNLMKQNPITLFLMLSLTLGLAPFFPEPHLAGKIRWVLGGGVGMQTMDYFDLCLHGTPWVGLIVVCFKRLINKKGN